MDTMGTRIKTLRLASGLTQAQLGAALGVTKATISQWERGVIQNIRLKTFIALCEQFRTHPNFLIYGNKS